MKIIFFLGAHRTGTKAMAHFFKEHYSSTGVLSYHQFNLLRWVNVLSNMYADGVLPENVYRLLIRQSVVRRIRNLSCSTYIESNGFNYLAADVVRRCFPDVKVVHLVRDPRDFVRSYLNWTEERWKSRLAHRWIPFWNPDGYRTGAYGRREWAKMDRFQRFCWYWTFKNEKIRRLYSDNPDTFLSVRFEDLVGREHRQDTLRKLLNFMGLSYQAGSEQFFDERQNAAAGQHFPRWPEWDSPRCRQLQAICSPLMAEYGYGTEPLWKKKLEGDALATKK